MPAGDERNDTGSPVDNGLIEAVDYLAGDNRKSAGAIQSRIAPAVTLRLQQSAIAVDPPVGFADHGATDNHGRTAYLQSVQCFV